VKVHHPSPEVSVALSLALVVREVGVEGVYFPLGVCFSATPIVDKGVSPPLQLLTRVMISG